MALTMAFGKPPFAAVMVSEIVTWRRAFAYPLDPAIPVPADRPAVLAALDHHDAASVHSPTPLREVRMNFIAPMAEPRIREIPLSRLTLGPKTSARHRPTPQADAALKDSIAALGLLENLVVRADEPDENGGERFTATITLPIPFPAAPAIWIPAFASSRSH